MKVTEETIRRFKELNDLRKAGKATPEQLKEAAKLAKILGKVRRPKEGSNDISWYEKYPELLKDAANIIFNEIAGTEFAVSDPAASNNINWPIVGAKIDVLVTPGKSRTANDAYNYQMRQLWLWLHRTYRGIGTYEYADLGIVLFSIMCAFADVARAERIYGICSNFKARNRSYPKAVLEALAVNPSTIDAAELADFRFQLNRIIAKSQILCLPKGFSALEALITMFSNIFKDAENDRAQWYVYDNPYLMKYDATFATGGRITYGHRTVDSTGLQTLDQIISDLNDQFDTLLSDTDVARMCSDLLKAFGDNGVVQLNPVPENYVIEPIRDEVREIQLHNSTLVGQLCGAEFSSTVKTALGAFTTNLETLCIYQEGGVIKHVIDACGQSSSNDVAMTPSDYKAFIPGECYGFTTDVSVNYELGSPILNTYADSPGQTDVVEMTRQVVSVEKSSVTISGTTYYRFTPHSFSLFVPMSMKLYSNNNALGNYARSFIGKNVIPVTNLASATSVMLTMGEASMIDWHPRIVARVITGGVVTISIYSQDIDNYSLISPVALGRIHDACTLSLFKLATPSPSK